MIAVHRRQSLVRSDGTLGRLAENPRLTIRDEQEENEEWRRE